MLNKTDQTYLNRLAQSAVSFTHEPNATGKGTRLVRSTVSGSLQKHYHRLAVDGYCAESITGSHDPGPPQTVVSYTLTALGRDALGLHKPLAKPVNRSRPLSESELYRDGIE